MRKGLLALAIGVLVAGCGGGGDGGGNDQGPKNSIDVPRYSGTYLYISDLSVDKDVVKAGEPFTISWSVTTDSRGHYATFDIYNTDLGMNVGYMDAPCDYSYCSLTCTVQMSYDGNYMWIDCGRFSSTSFYAFNFELRLQACVSDPNAPWQSYCDTRSVYLTVTQ